ncbi:MAG: DUF481 domain-containing protein [Acidobacteriaceae bacterium]
MQFQFKYLYSVRTITFLACLLVVFSLFSTIPIRAADSSAHPDLLVFANGDHLNGKLDHAEGGKVVFASDNAGTVTVAWAKIQELHSDRQFAVIKTGTEVLRKQANPDIPVGTIRVKGDTLTVTTSQGSVQIPVKAIAFLVDEPTFEKNVRNGQGLLQGVTGSISAGLSTVSSTQNSVSINSAVVLSREVPPVTWMPARRRTLLDFSNNYGRVSQPNTPTVKTSIFHGGLEEDEYLSARFYLLQRAMYDHNFSQGLDLQQLYGLGAGYTFIKDAVQELDLTGVIDYTKQQFSASGSVLNVPPDYSPAYSKNLIGSSFGDSYVRKLPRKIVFTEVAVFNPAWNSPSDYSANIAVGATFPVYKNFGFSVGLIDSYLNNPPPGFKGNSVQFNTGLTYTLH